MNGSNKQHTQPGGDVNKKYSKIQNKTNSDADRVCEAFFDHLHGSLS